MEERFGTGRNDQGYYLWANYTGEQQRIEGLTEKEIKLLVCALSDFFLDDGVYSAAKRVVAEWKETKDAFSDSMAALEEALQKII